MPSQSRDTHSMTQVKAISFTSPVLVSLTLIGQVNGNISFVDQHNSVVLRLPPHRNTGTEDLAVTNKSIWSAQLDTSANSHGLIL